MNLAATCEGGNRNQKQRHVGALGLIVFLALCLKKVNGGITRGQLEENGKIINLFILFLQFK